MNRWPLPLALLALLGFYVGERALGGNSRWVVSGLSALGFSISLALAILRYARATDERRRAHRSIVSHYALILLGVGLYALQLPEIGVFGDGKVRTVVMVAWPAVVLLGLGPLVTLELALRSVESAPKIELWRLRLAARSALL